MLSEVSMRLFEMNIMLDVKKSVKEYLIDNGYDAKFGARPLRRLIQKEIEDPISMEILKGRCTSGTRIVVSMRKGKIRLSPKKPEPKPVADKASVQN